VFNPHFSPAFYCGGGAGRDRIGGGNHRIRLTLYSTFFMNIVGTVCPAMTNECSPSGR